MLDFCSSSGFWIVTLAHRRDPWAFFLPAFRFIACVCVPVRVCVYVLFPRLSSFRSATPFAYLVTSCQTAASSLSIAPLLSPSSLFFNPTLPEPVRMSSGLLCKRHGRGMDLVLGCHTPDQPPSSCSPSCVVVALECFLCELAGQRERERER